MVDSDDGEEDANGTALNPIISNSPVNQIVKRTKT